MLKGKHVNISINGQPAELKFLPNAYKQGNQVFVKLSDSRAIIESYKNEDLSIYKDIKTGEICAIVIKKFKDLGENVT